MNPNGDRKHDSTIAEILGRLKWRDLTFIGGGIAAVFLAGQIFSGFMFFWGADMAELRARLAAQEEARISLAADMKIIPDLKVQVSVLSENVLRLRDSMDEHGRKFDRLWDEIRPPAQARLEAHQPQTKAKN